MNQHARFQSLLATSLIGALALAYVVTIFLPRQRAVAALRTQLAEKQDFIMQSELLRPVVESKTDELRETEAFINSQRQQVPDLAQLPEMFGTISDKIREAGARTERFEPAPPTDCGALRKLPVRMTVQGSFEQLFQLLSDLEGLPAPLWIDELEISQEAEDGTSLACTFNVAVFAAEGEISD